MTPEAQALVRMQRLHVAKAEKYRAEDRPDLATAFEASSQALTTAAVSALVAEEREAVSLLQADHSRRVNALRASLFPA